MFLLTDIHESSSVTQAMVHEWTFMFFNLLKEHEGVFYVFCDTCRPQFNGTSIWKVLKLIIKEQYLGDPNIKIW